MAALATEPPPPYLSVSLFVALCRYRHPLPLVPTDIGLGVAAGSECAAAPMSFTRVWLIRVLGPIGFLILILVIAKIACLDMTRIVVRSYHSYIIVF